MDANGLAQQNLQDHKQGMSGNIINIEDAMNINRDEEDRLVAGWPRDLVTVLLHKSVCGRDDHLSAHNKHGDRR